jgi:hypothetical protein
MKLKRSSGEGKDWAWFRCPGCAQALVPGGETHLIDTTWDITGTDDCPTVSPSVLVRFADGQRCHSFIRQGRIQYLSDCTHPLAGQTVDLPDWPTTANA